MGALLLWGLSLGLNVAGADVPASLHPDEARLVRVATGAPHDWSDPALLSHVARGIGALTLPGDAARIAGVGSTLSAFLGALAVFLVWLLAREELPPGAALFAAASVAASPLLVLPAHAFAPDAASLALGLASIFSLLRLAQRGTLGWALAAGASIGLALSVHYGGALLVLCGASTLAIAPPLDRPRLRVRLTQAAGLAALLFVMTNAALFTSLDSLIAGPLFQVQRLFRGDHLFVPPWAHGFTYHLRNTLWPGVTLPLLTTAIVGLGAAALRKRRLGLAARLLLLYAGLAWLIAELSPLKPSPAGLRYVLPVLAAIGLGAGLAAEALGTVVRARWAQVALLLAVLAFPIAESAGLLRARSNETRLQADAWLTTHAGRALRGRHASAAPLDVGSIASVDLDAARRSGVTHAATSSFVYATFVRGSRLAGQTPYVYDRHERYQELFEYPYEEFRPDGPSLGWNNPTIRILDIREPRPPGRPRAE